MNQQRLVERIKADLTDPQRQLAFVNDQSTSDLALSGLWSFGKTYPCAPRLYPLPSPIKALSGCVMEPTGPLIRDIWQNDFEQFLEQYDARQLQIATKA